MLRAAASALLLSALVALTGCDTATPPLSAPMPFQVAHTAAGITLNASTPDPSRGDVLFHLDPLPADAVVSAELRTSAADPRLEYAAADGDIRLVAEGARAVEVAYLADGREVAPRTAHKGGADAYSAGSTDTGPTSYHYVTQADGSVVIRWDYNNDGRRLTDPSATRGATVRTPAGEVVRVTDVSFRAWGLDLGTIESVEIGSPSQIYVAEASVRR